MTKDLPEDTPIGYHAYYKGCCLYHYPVENVWLFPKDKQDSPKEIKMVVMNPGEDYDDRASNKKPQQGIKK